jgi:hypothetical protein
MSDMDPKRIRCLMDFDDNNPNVDEKKIITEKTVQAEGLMLANINIPSGTEVTKALTSGTRRRC